MLLYSDFPSCVHPLLMPGFAETGAVTSPRGAGRILRPNHKYTVYHTFLFNILHLDAVSQLHGTVLEHFPRPIRKYTVYLHFY